MDTLKTLECPNCNAPLELASSSPSTVRCPFCGTVVVIPPELRGRQPGETPPSFEFSQAVLQGLPGSPTPQDLEDAVRKIRGHLDSGNKIEAIKEYRRLANVGLKEAKDAVDAFERDGVLSLPPAEVSVAFDQFLSGLPPGIEEKIRGLVTGGNKIEAIKVYRASADASLKDAKDAIDALARTGILQNPHTPVPQKGFTFQESGVIYEVARLINQGERSHAVDAYRRGFASSHVEAKAVVDALVRSPDQDPQRVALQARLKARANPALRLGLFPALFGGGACAVTALVVVILLISLLGVLIPLALPGAPLHPLLSRVDPFAFANLKLSFGGEGTGPGLFTDPRPLAVASNGDVYVGDYQDGRIQRFTGSGEFQNLWQVPKKQYIQRLAAGRNGVVYAVYGGDIWQYEGATGKLLGTVENPQDFYFDDMVLTADGGMVAVKDSEDLVRFDAGGDILWIVEDAISTVTDDNPSSAHLAVDGLGNIYLVDSFHYSVFKYNPEGRYLNRWGEEGDGPGQFTALLGVAVDSYGRVYASDFSGIHVFSSAGNYIASIHPSGVAYDMAFDGENGLWVTTGSKKVARYLLRNP